MLSPKYVGPNKVFERIGLMVYKMVLLEKYEGNHVVFNVSSLRESYGN